MKDKPLTVEIKDGELQISIGIDTLCFAVSEKIADFKITDNEGFAKDILNELENEYRKVCECNERLPYSPNDFKSNIRMYKACDYHSARKVKGISYA